MINVFLCAWQRRAYMLVKSSTTYCSIYIMMQSTQPVWGFLSSITYKCLNERGRYELWPISRFFPICWKTRTPNGDQLQLWLYCFECACIDVWNFFLISSWGIESLNTLAKWPQMYEGYYVDRGRLMGHRSDPAPRAIVYPLPTAPHSPIPPPA